MSAQKTAPPGQMVETGGFQLHAIACGQGSPAVMLEPALGGFALQYSHIQAAVAAFTRVLAYDRAGQGWSDPSPNLRTPENMDRELHALQSSLGFQPPYILVGHSFGGLLVRFYAGFHPEETAGVVLVDSSDVEMYDSFPDLDKLISRAAVGVRLLKLAARIGLGRQVAKLSMGSAAKTLPEEDLEAFTTVASRPVHQETMLAEFAQHRRYFGPRADVPRTLGDIPLTIITAGNSVSAGERMGRLSREQINAQHLRLQQDLTRISTRSQQIVVPGASHLSLLTQPEHVAVVADAIHRMIERERL